VPSKKLVDNFKQAGFALGAIPTEMKKVTDYTRSIGVNTAQVSTMVVDNLKNLNLYNFENGIQGITKMAAQSALFGVSMSRIFTISEDLFSPEKAIEMAASFQRLGVSTSALLDPLKLMDMGQNNPQELQNQIVEMTKKFTYFDETNKKFQILPGAQREMREIAGVLGMGADELARMAIGSSELTKKMSEIRFPTLSTGPMTEEQKQMIANMSEMRGGEYKVMVEQKDAAGNLTGIMKEKSITELSDKDIETLSESSKPKALEDIAKEQLTALNRIANAVTSNVTAPLAGAFASSTIQGTRGITYSAQAKLAKDSESIIKPDQMTKMTDSIIKAVASMAEKKISGEDITPTDLLQITNSLSEGFGDIRKNFNTAKDKVKDDGNTELEKFRNLLRSGSNNSSQTPQPQQTPQQQTPQLQQIQAPQEIEEPDSSGSAMSVNDVTALVSKMTPDINMLAKQIEGGNKTEINESLAKIGAQLGKSGMNEESIGKLAEHIMPKLTDEQIKTITSASSGMLSNQLQPKEQPKEQTGVANMIKPEEIKGLVTEMMPDPKDYANQIKSNDTEGAEKIGKVIESQLSKLDNGDKTMKTLTDRMEDDSKLTKDQIKSIANTGKIKEKTQTQIIGQPKEQTGIASTIKPEEIKGMVEKMLPDSKDYANQIKSNNKVGEEKTGKDNEPQLSKFGMDDKTMKVFADMNVAKIKVSEDQIKSMITNTKNAIEQNETQQPQTIDQPKEQTGIASMIKPEEIKGLVEQMLPDFKNLAQQMESGDEKGAEKTGKDIELQLSKFGMDDKTMKMFTDMISNSTTLTDSQIKTLANTTKTTEKNETQKPQIAQQSQPQTEGPKLSWMKQIDAFDKVTQGVAGETQTVTNSQVNDLNNQTVTATNNNQQQQTNQSDYLIDRISQAQAQTQIVEHKFDGTITIKVDAPPGVNAAYVTKTINDMVNSPDFTNKIMKDQKIMANNYGLTGGKVSELTNSSSTGFSV
jgi:phage FluMu protein gp41